MRKELFQSVCDRLKLIQQDQDGNYTVAAQINEQLTAIKHFDLWNQNLEYLDEEQPFNTPAVFIEFAPINWRHQGQGVRDASVMVKLHVVTRRNMPTRSASPYAGEALGFFALVDAINLCLHGHKGQQFGAFTGEQSETDHDFDELMHSTETYVTLVTDTSAHRPPPRTAAAIVIE